MHQMLDMEVAQRQEAEKLSEDQSLNVRTLEEDAELLKNSVTELARDNEMATSVQSSEERIRELEDEKQELQKDLDKIMGNLTRW
tara:strand:- start:1791 stop:2045 length:255 start_codon:yes stop_codon:yes gene_type:complete